MADSDQKQLLKTFHRSLSDRPIPPDDERYVPVYEHASSDPIEEIATDIGFAESASVSLLTGQRGTGKSTELLRLKSLLEEDDAIVFIVDISDYLNLTTPVEITDFLITVMTAFSEEVHSKYQQNLTQEDYLTRLENFLKQDINLQDFGFSLAGLNIKASLKSDPTYKQRLQDSLKGHSARLVAQAHEFVMEIVDLIRTQEQDADKKIVLMIDSIEQIRGVGSDANKVYESVENLFNKQTNALKLPSINVLYTVPPYLQPLAPNLATSLSGVALYNLPSIHIRTKDNQSDPDGLAQMQSIISKRCANWQQVISIEQLDRLAIISGGDLRNFFRLVKLCVVKAGSKAGLPLPIEDYIVELTINQARSELFLTEVDKVWLKKIHQTKQHQLQDVDKMPQLARFFDTGLVLNYRNGENWYDVHPLISEKL